MKNIAACLLILVLVSSLGCARVLSRDVQITGDVRLSDDPGTNAGVLVSNGFQEAVTDHSGYFTIEGKIVAGDADFTLTFSKNGYVSETRTIQVKFSGDTTPSNSDFDSIISLGTITLTAI